MTQPHPPVCFAVGRINPNGPLTVTSCFGIIPQLTVSCSPASNKFRALCNVCVQVGNEKGRESVSKHFLEQFKHYITLGSALFVYCLPLCTNVQIMIKGQN